MTTAVTITPASGAITAAQTVCRVDLTGFDANTSDGYDINAYPTSPEMRYYISFVEGGTEYGRSYVFDVNGGAHTFNNYIFPHAGTWTVGVFDASDDSSVDDISVTVA